MNEILIFFQDVFLGTTKSYKPVGLSTLNKQVTNNKPSKKGIKNSEVKLSDLMRRPQ